MNSQRPGAIWIGSERKYSHEIGVVWIGNACAWNPAALRSAYELVIKSWSDAGLAPHRLAASAPGVGRKYGAFDRKRRFVERADFNKVGTIEMVRIQPGCTSEMSDWEMEATLSQKLGMFSAGCVLSLVGDAASFIEQNALNLFELSGCRYGWMFRQRLRFSPGAYAFGLTVHVDDDPRHDDHRKNIQSWHPSIERLGPTVDAGILRDVFAENYLAWPHLEASLGNTATTLKQWIEADRASRGTLEPYTDILTKWTPPVEKIPQIREELYRAGRVFYWQFFRPPGANRLPGPFFRPDLSAPWEAPDPIPEIYRADYWKDKDPGLTY